MGATGCLAGVETPHAHLWMVVTNRCLTTAAVEQTLGAEAASLGDRWSPRARGSGTGHLNGGTIDIGDGTILVDVDCSEASVLFDVSAGGVSEEWHCSNIEASGPLGDAEVDLLCVSTWDDWPVNAASHMRLQCDMSITIFDQPFPPPTDALCVLTVDHLFAGHAGNNSTGGLWHADDASDLFEGVEANPACPPPLPAAINFFVGSGTSVLLHFLFMV
jgi:hypothetical protein